MNINGWVQRHVAFNVSLPPTQRIERALLVITKDYRVPGFPPFFLIKKGNTKGLRKKIKPTCRQAGSK
jgi:hypothetical protein